MRWLLLSVFPLTVGACFFDSALPLDSLLGCRASKDCPEPLLCLVTEERCIPPGSACITLQDGFAVAQNDGNTCGPNSICVRGACQAQQCGDGFITGDETCDGAPGCRENCTRCGDGITDPGEDCDNGPGNGVVTAGACPSTCVAECGNGFVEFGEACDDGNSNPADGCDACTQTTWRSTALIGASVSAAQDDLRPEGVAVDRFGNVYIATDDRIRRVDNAGDVTTVAGTGTAGLSGDGGPATSAELHYPNGLAIDGLGNIYFADTGNNRIRRVDTAGIITTLAGTSPDPFQGGFSGDGGAATSAELFRPQDVAVDGLGNIYIADMWNHRIRRIDPTGVITTIAGTEISVEIQVCDTRSTELSTCDATETTCTYVYGERRCQSRAGVDTQCHGGFQRCTWTRDGDTSTSSCEDIDADDTETETSCREFETNTVGGFNGDGIAATSAALSFPTGVAVDRLGNIYIADAENRRIRQINPSGIISTLAGTGSLDVSGDGGPASSAGLGYPTCVEIDDRGNIYVCSGDRIRRIDSNGIITTSAGTGIQGFSGDGSVATSAQFFSLETVAVDGRGNIYVADNGNGRVRRIDTDGVITTVAGRGLSPNLPGTTSTTGEGGAATAATLREPNSVAFDAIGNVYIADTSDCRIRRVDRTGTIATFAGTGFYGFSGDGAAATSATLSSPAGVAVDGLGNVYIVDSGNHRIRRVAADGIITTIAGTESDGGYGGFSGDGGAATNAELSQPRAVAVDGLGNVYIADTNNSRIRRVGTDGIITTFAGTGNQGFSGDGGAATSADVGWPVALAVDEFGNVYFADALSRSVRRVDTTGIITTFAGGTIVACGDGAAATSAMLESPTRLASDRFGKGPRMDKSIETAIDSAPRS